MDHSDHVIAHVSAAPCPGDERLSLLYDTVLACRVQTGLNKSHRLLGHISSTGHEPLETIANALQASFELSELLETWPAGQIVPQR